VGRNAILLCPWEWPRSGTGAGRWSARPVESGLVREWVGVTGHSPLFGLVAR